MAAAKTAASRLNGRRSRMAGIRFEPGTAASAWLNCSPATPWGVHGRIVEDRCTRCGWEA
jgi:hypothetical protein